MIDYSEILNLSPYNVEKREKVKILSKRLGDLTQHHVNSCLEYNRILNGMNCNLDSIKNYYDIPYLPVRLFKELELKSIKSDDVFKTLTSSGTTGQTPSKIFLDRRTASYQQKTLVKIVSDFTGKDRLPMIILDCPSVIKDQKMFSARGAGILGFSILGTDRIYALNDDMDLDLIGIKKFLDNHCGETILLYGFTFMIWQYFYKKLLEHFNATREKLDLSKGILIHGGGWKKLFNEAVSNNEFNERLYDICSLKSIHDYYGMVEQTGCIYMQCEAGHLHASTYSDIIIRDPLDFSICPIGKKGIIQVVSAIPESYPGHSLLTEDEGIVLGEDKCCCGRKGKYFSVIGRIANAEIRGCSDTYAAQFK